MKRKIIVISLALIMILAIAGGSMAWQTNKSEERKNEFKVGTVNVKVVESGLKNISKVAEGTYDKNIRVESLGTKRTYVRVRLIPEWNEPSLPVSNVKFNLSSNGHWTNRQLDGYYYFKYYLTEDQLTSLLLESLTFTDLDPEYEGADFTLKIVAEGVQTTHEAWKNVWGVTNLPFTPEQPWTP